VSEWQPCGLVIETQEEVFEMNNGCICCTVRGDLIRILVGQCNVNAVDPRLETAWFGPLSL
jgi:G3E family GTPase